MRQKASIRSERQVRFCNAFEALRDLGFRPTQIAEMMGCTHGRLTQVVEYGEEPSKMMVQSILLLVEKRSPNKDAPLREAILNLDKELKKLKQAAGISSSPGNNPGKSSASPHPLSWQGPPASAGVPAPAKRPGTPRAPGVALPITWMPHESQSE